jgi:hypothetical protein
MFPTPLWKEDFHCKTPQYTQLKGYERRPLIRACMTCAINFLFLIIFVIYIKKPKLPSMQCQFNQKTKSKIPKSPFKETLNYFLYPGGI